MARIRTIKPEFFLDEQIAERLNPVERLLWIGLWCLADSEGRLEDRPKFIKSQVFPYESVNVDAALQKLHQHGYVVRYEIGKKYLQIKNFLKYQRPYHKEPKSEIPLPVIAASTSGHDRKESAGLLSMDILSMDYGSELKTKSKISLSAEGMFKNISDQKIQVWEKAYPGINVRTEVGAAGSWAFANPKNKKSNWERFIVNWLKRSQDKSRPEKNGLNGSGSINDQGSREWSKILLHVKTHGSSQRCEGISDQARTALNKLGGLMEVGKCNDFKIRDMEKSFKDMYLQQQTERKIT